jgi:hypothetical protein
MTNVWEEIRGFASLGEYKRFCTYIENKVTSGLARERNPDPNYNRGTIVGGRWFEDIETNEVWRLIAPDIPFRGLWERVEKGRYDLT